MILNLDFQSNTPIYQQICNQIILWISTGQLKPGQRLPTVRALAEEAGINSMTVNKAYQQLKADGYIVTERRNGAIVNQQMQKSGTMAEEDRQQLQMIISKSRIAGVTKKEFLEICENLYDSDESVKQ